MFVLYFILFIFHAVFSLFKQLIDGKSWIIPLLSKKISCTEFVGIEIESFFIERWPFSKIFYYMSHNIWTIYKLHTFRWVKYSGLLLSNESNDQYYESNAVSKNNLYKIIVDLLEITGCAIFGEPIKLMFSEIKI